ncbi:MAG TPA: DUF3667 domain-containing protein [Pyrinomonadaceae bacterium]|nr:DUF3667 domain-containing protein [Pyrinomonadaceae bacterium]
MSNELITCPNCEASFESKFCPDCGQKRIDKHEFAVGHFFGHIVHEFTHLDSNKIIRTFVDLVIKPGRLTFDYLAGRKGKYINPIRVYLTVSAIYFLFAWGALATAGGGSAQDNSSRQFVIEMAKRKNVEPTVLAEKIQDKAGKYAGTFRFASVLISGLFLMLLFRSSGRYYVEHLIFSLHFYSFDFLAKTVVALVFLTETYTGHTTFIVARVLYYVLAFVYLLFALKLVYGLSNGKTAIRAVAQSAFEFVLFIVVNALGFVFATFLA